MGAIGGTSKITYLALGSICALSIGCAKSAPLDPLDAVQLESIATQNVQVNFCTDPAFTQKQYLKTIVVFDHSGSNQENYLMAADGSGAPAVTGGTIEISPSLATDPTGQTRYGNIATPGTLLNYLSQLPANNPADPTRFFALVDFNGSATSYPPNAAGFTSDIAGFYNYVQADATASGGHPNDGGSTSYLGALNQVYNIIENDIQSAKRCAALPVGSSSPGSWCPTPGVPVASSYVIVFMSDGAPIINISGVGQNSSGQTVITGPIQITKESSTDILGEVQTITGLASNTQFVAGLNLFTIYYYHPGNVDQSGQQLLADMAKVGNGISYDALSGANINYANFQPPTKLIKYTLSDVFVTNASVHWWNNGQLHLDSDMDGLPDDAEISWGSDAHKPDTQGNGVSDYVRYVATHAQVCAHKNAQGICIDAPINYASGICSGISSTTSAAGLTFASSDPDGLNNCEKTVLNDVGGIGNPDSNGDGIPDFLEFVNGIPFQLGTSPALNTPDADGYTLYEKVKFSLPTNYPLTDLEGVQPSQYNMTLVSSNQSQDCYNLNVTGLPMVGDNNTIRVDVIEKSPLLQSSYLYRVGKKAFTAGSSNLVINDWNNAAEQAAGTWSQWP